MKAKLDLITFEQAMRSTGRQSIDAYGEHVTPVEAHLLRLIGIDRRYTRAVEIAPRAFNLPELPLLLVLGWYLLVLYQDDAAAAATTIT